MLLQCQNRDPFLGILLKAQIDKLFTACTYFHLIIESMRAIDDCVNNPRDTDSLRFGWEKGRSIV